MLIYSARCSLVVFFYHHSPGEPGLVAVAIKSAWETGLSTWRCISYTDCVLTNCLHSSRTALQPVSKDVQINDPVISNMSSTQQKGEPMNQCWFNPLSPHDASNHHFTYLKTDFIVFIEWFYKQNIH